MIWLRRSRRFRWENFPNGSVLTASHPDFLRWVILECELERGEEEEEVLVIVEEQDADGES